MVIDPKRSLQFLSPKIAAQWHVIKNGSLTPHDVSCGSSKKVWWQCEKFSHHEWDASIGSRTNGSGCPFCSGNKVSAENCLANVSPEIAAEWHSMKNGSLTPHDVSYASARKVWWQCEKFSHHEWDALISSRTGLRQQGCPFCAGKRVSFERSLANLSKAIAEEWHPTKNGSLTPVDVLNGSRKDVWWQCPENSDHVYLATIANRTRLKPVGSGCPFCSNKKVSLDNSLQTRSPEIAKEWHPIKNGSLTPKGVVDGSHKKVWWQCSVSKKHEWEAVIKSRTGNGYGCPFCAGKQVSDENSLFHLSPNIAAEWHPTKNGSLTPKDVVNGANKKVWWQCPKSKEHEWQTMVISRTHKTKPTGCPFCSNQSSKQEIRILSELETVFSKVISRYRSNKKEIDIYLPEHLIGVEFDGWYFHKGKEQNDCQKNKYFQSQGICLIRVREEPLRRISDNDVLVTRDKFTKSDMNIIFEVIRKYVPSYSESINEYIRSLEFKNEELYKTYLDCFPSPLPGNSLECLFPEIAKEWHFTKNSPLLPRNFASKSHFKVWWQCSKSKKHVYEASISSRTGSKSGCPFCAGQQVSDENSLIHLSPDIAAEWHPNKNGSLTPRDITNGSNKKVWWQCNKDKNHHWESTVVNRTKKINPTGCPFCSGKKVNVQNSLAKLYPDIAAEWHAKKNQSLTPYDVTKGSDKRVWWQCSKINAHVWEARIYERTRNDRPTGCPFCSGNRKY